MVAKYLHDRVIEKKQPNTLCLFGSSGAVNFLMLVNNLFQNLPFVAVETFFRCKAALITIVRLTADFMCN